MVDPAIFYLRKLVFVPPTEPQLRLKLPWPTTFDMFETYRRAGVCTIWDLARIAWKDWGSKQGA